MEHWHIWIALAILLAMAEILTPGFVVLCFAGGAVLAALVAALGLPLVWQILAFAAGSFISFVTIRPAMQKWASNKSESEKTNIDRLIGQEAVVLEPTNAEQGLVKIQGERWSARSADGSDLEAGSRVTVERIEGNKVIVARKG